MTSPVRRARHLRRNETDAEYRLWCELRNRRLNGYKFRRQHPVGSYVADLACLEQMLIVEVDGSQHAESETDARRTAVLNRLGWSVLRFWNDEVLREGEAVLETILAVLDRRIVEACDGAGLIEGLRFAPGTPSPSPASLRSAPSPASGRGRAPIPETLKNSHLPSPKRGEGVLKGRMRVAP